MMFMTAMMMMILAMKKKMVMIMMISCLAIRTGISCRLADSPVLVIWDWSTVLMFFIGPRCPWGPIYGSGSLSLTE